MQNSSAFQYLALDTIHESTTNPRRTFDEGKLQELADFVSLTILWPQVSKGAWRQAVRDPGGT
jgi:hypothetical protein